jgi:hypothetical protein
VKAVAALEGKIKLDVQEPTITSRNETQGSTEVNPAVDGHQIYKGAGQHCLTRKFKGRGKDEKSR